MGWWKIKNVETGRIDFGTPINPESKLVNAIPRIHPKEWLYNGDDPVDKMTMCIKKIRKHYKKALGKDPTKRELKAVFNFCVNPLDLKQ